MYANQINAVCCALQGPASRDAGHVLNQNDIHVVAGCVA